MAGSLLRDEPATRPPSHPPPEPGVAPGAADQASMRQAHDAGEHSRTRAPRSAGPGRGAPATPGAPPAGRVGVQFLPMSSTASRGRGVTGTAEHRRSDRRSKRCVDLRPSPRSSPSTIASPRSPTVTVASSTSSAVELPRTSARIGRSSVRLSAASSAPSWAASPSATDANGSGPTWVRPSSAWGAAASAGRTSGRAPPRRDATIDAGPRRDLRKQWCTGERSDRDRDR